MKLLDKEVVYRLVPCPCYEVEACESWLTDMAAQGLFVEKLGRTLARFRRGLPQTVRYRLTAARLKGSWLDVVPSEPLSTEKALYAEYGWEFICSQQEFFLYACRGPQAPELHTDPAVQALSLKMARKSAWWALIGGNAVLVIQFALNGRGRLARLFVEMPLLSCCMYLYFFGALFLAARDLYNILQLSRRLRLGYAPDHRKNWHPTAWVNRISRGITVCAFFLGILLAFWMFVQFSSRQPIKDYQGPLPFATLQDLTDGTLVQDEDEYNTLERRHSLLAPTILEYSESGVILQGEEAPWDPSLSVQYYDTRSPWLAKLLVNDLHQQRSILAEEPQPLPDLAGMDAAYAYSGKEGVFRQLILVQGNRVLSVLWVDPDGTHGFDRLAPRFAEAFAASA
ncbi:DUF2812 domain-containing protein [Subdoligranulum variabile]|uniref:DUF2812 domain-containing protein n=1 Tax=Subdoligranulum variabile TaxID=214851 RepID=UPI0026ED3569|nr:DUF2812 domain-containing protein [Subdoligranulum variabile]